MQAIRGIYRYPIKGLSAQPVGGVTLEVGQPFPFDRVFALARPNVPVDRDNPKWAKKGFFVMLMIDEALAEIRSELNPDTRRFRAWSGSNEIFGADLTTEEGRVELENFIQRLVPSLTAAPKLLQSRDGHFMDKPDNVISLINLATVRSLEEEWGCAIDPLRFRANFYVDGLRPWQEFEWIGKDIRLGDAVLRVDRKNGRCGATNVNPANGRRDLDIPGALRAKFGHKDLGVYLVTRKGGKVAVGDSVEVPPSTNGEPVRPTPAANRNPGAAGRRLICRGCYYIYEEPHGPPADGSRPSVMFADLPTDWRCPDCGAEKSSFRPYEPF